MIAPNTGPHVKALLPVVAGLVSPEDRVGSHLIEAEQRREPVLIRGGGCSQR